MENLLNFPQSTIVNKVVPKNAFYGRSAQKTWLKDLLTREFDSIVWLYKLTAHTLNVADGDKVQEIDVFLCKMKEDLYSINSFCGMDELLPRHTMFVIEYGEHTDLLMHYKEKTLVRGEEKWKLGDTELLRDVDLSELHIQLTGSSLDSVYAGLLGQVSKLNTLSNSEYEQAAAQRKKNLQMQKQLETLEKKCRAEKQPRRKYELYQQILKIKEQL
jgi:hypothetical protein